MREGSEGLRAALLQPPNLITGVGHFNYGHRSEAGDVAARKSPLTAVAHLPVKLLQVDNSGLSSSDC